ncbi:MAG: hypothetical protein QXS02_01105 [Candidatus Thermoplasmatota archaeon]
MSVIDRLIYGMREYSLAFSIMLLVIGLFLFFMGLFYWVAKNLQIWLFRDIHEWNAYVLVFGLIVFGVGLYYLYLYVKRWKFINKELKTNKRSEFLKSRVEIEAMVKHLPSKYRKRVEEKKNQLGIE